MTSTENKKKGALVDDCIFCKIIAGKVPSYKVRVSQSVELACTAHMECFSRTTVYEDDDVISFLDAFPAASGHTLVCCKKHYETVDEVPAEIGAKVFAVLSKVARGVKALPDVKGYNVIQNNGKAAGQVVPHVHFHIIPRRADDNLFKFPGSAKEMISKDAATAVKEGISNNMLAAVEAPKLTRQLSEKSATLRALFVELDKNKDGKLNQEEFKVCVQQLSGSTKVPDLVVQMMLEEADLDSSGDVDFDEFVKFLALKQN